MSVIEEFDWDGNDLPDDEVKESEEEEEDFHYIPQEKFVGEIIATKEGEGKLLYFTPQVR